MNIEGEIKTNLQIAKLIKSKYSEATLLFTLTTLEAKYYRLLIADIRKAKSAIDNEGLAELLDDSPPFKPVKLEGM
jgi:hypothetical protein